MPRNRPPKNLVRVIVPKSGTQIYITTLSPGQDVPKRAKKRKNCPLSLCWPLRMPSVSEEKIAVCLPEVFLSDTILQGSGGGGAIRDYHGAEVLFGNRSPRFFAGNSCDDRGDEMTASTPFFPSESGSKKSRSQVGEKCKKTSDFFTGLFSYLCRRGLRFTSAISRGGTFDDQQRQQTFLGLFSLDLTYVPEHRPLTHLAFKRPRSTGRLFRGSEEWLV